MKFCTHCGHKSEGDTKFCAECGCVRMQSSTNKYSSIWKDKSFLAVLAVGVILMFGGVTAYFLYLGQGKILESAPVGVATTTASSTDMVVSALHGDLTDIPKVDGLANVFPTQTPSDSGSYTVAEIVRGWQNRVAIVECFDDYGETVSSGSATFVTLNGILAAVSNDHVIDSGYGTWPSSCAIGIYGIGGRVVDFSPNKFFSLADQGLDAAGVVLSNADYTNDEGAFDIISTNPMPVCTLAEVSIGDDIVILGYPWNGSQSGVTASNGIIAGFDGNDYVTNAKIEHGNSGGAAILMKRNCWLGIPTSALVGSVESYGRILRGDLVL